MARHSLFTFVISSLSNLKVRIEEAIITQILNVRFGRVKIRRGDLVRHSFHPKEISLVVDVRPRRSTRTNDVLIILGGETFWVMSSMLERIDEIR